MHRPQRGPAVSADRWFYLDSSGTQFGPCTAAELREALRLGRATPACLAWRDGLDGWQPIASLAPELGLATTAPPPMASPVPATPPPPVAMAPAAETDPYRAPASREMERADNSDIVYAGFLRRLAAYFLDSLILLVPLSLLGALFNGPTPLPTADPWETFRASMLAQGPQQLLWLLVAPLYYALQESSSVQATLGKRAMRIKVTDRDGKRLSFGHALGRWFAAALSYLTLYIGFLMAAFTDQKRALHDMVAGTLVVDQWAFTAHPERQDRSLSGCGLAVLLVMIALPVLAIVAALMIAGAVSQI
jgi:uncharacterized RDD family membrane protein YckC